MQIEKKIKYPFLIMIILFFSCNKAQNYKDAYMISDRNYRYIKLRGKRNLMSHDFGSLFKNGTFEDSILIPVPTIKTGRINGNTITFDRGSYQYNYKGWINILGDNLEINLYEIDTINHGKNRINFSWNGRYKLYSPFGLRRQR